MIEKFLEAKRAAARTQGIKQRMLTGVLEKSFRTVKKAGLQDITIPEAETALQTTGRRLVTEQERPRLLVLRGKDTEVFTTSADQITVEATNKTDLGEAIHSVTEPFYGLFIDKMPTKVRRTRFLRRRVKKPLSVTWQENESSDDLQVQYKYKLDYTQTKEGNKMNTVSMTIASQHDPAGDYIEPVTSPVMSLHFNGTEVSQVGIHWKQEKPEALLKLTNDTPLGKFLNEMFVFKARMYRTSPGIDIDLGEIPKIHITNRLAGFLVHNTSTGKRDLPSDVYSWFEFRPTSKRFTRYFDNKQGHSDWGISTREQMDTNEFVKIVRSTLDLIPTMDLNTR